MLDFDNNLQMKVWSSKYDQASEYDRLYDKYVPQQGSSEYTEVEILRHTSNIIYDIYNNGFCNDKRTSLHYLLGTYDFWGMYSNDKEKEIEALLLELKELQTEEIEKSSPTDEDYDYYEDGYSPRPYTQEDEDLIETLLIAAIKVVQEFEMGEGT